MNGIFQSSVRILIEEPLCMSLSSLLGEDCISDYPFDDRACRGHQKDSFDLFLRFIPFCVGSFILFQRHIIVG
jgi:hypothetical protein